MKRLSARILMYGLAVALLAAVGALLWHVRERETTIYTDAGVIRVPEGRALVRDVMWHPAGTAGDRINTSDDEYAPRLTADGTTLFFVRGQPGRDADIFVSYRGPDGWSEPESLIEVNTAADELGPEPSMDGSRFYFYSNRSGGRGGYDLWVSDRGDDGWDEPRNLGPSVNSRYHEYGLAITVDGDRLYFASNRPRGTDRDVPELEASVAEIRLDSGRRDYDLYTARLNNGEAGTPVPVEALNTPHNEAAPAASQFGDFLYFCSDRPDGYGGFDVYRSRRVSGVHQSPLNLGEAVNTDADEMDPSLSQGGFTLHFSSNRRRPGFPAGSTPDYDLFTARSKEVFREMEAWRADVDWAGIWSVVGPLLAYIAVALLILLLLVKMQKTAVRPITLVARCILGSVLLHVIILLCLSAVEVSSSLAGMIKPGGGTRVLITSPSVGQTLAGQIRGGLTDLESQMVAESSSARQETAVTESASAEMATMQVERASIETESTPQTQATETAREATVQSTQRVEPAQVAQATEPVNAQVEVPVAPTRIESSETPMSEPSATFQTTHFERTAESTLPDPSTVVASAIAVDVQFTDLEAHAVHSDRMAETSEAEPVKAQTAESTDRVVAATAIDASAPTPQVALPQVLDAQAQSVQSEATVSFAAPAVRIEHRESLATAQPSAVDAATVAVATSAPAAVMQASDSMAPVVEFTPIAVSAPSVELSETDFVPAEMTAGLEVDLPDAGPQHSESPGTEAGIEMVAVGAVLAQTRTDFEIDTITDNVDLAPGEVDTTEMMTSLFTPMAPSTADLEAVEMVAIEGDPFLEGMNLVEAFDDAMPAMEEPTIQGDAVEMVAAPLPNVDVDATRAALPDLAFDEPGGPEWFENRVPPHFEPPEPEPLADVELKELAVDPPLDLEVDPYVELDPGPTAIVALLDLSIPITETPPPVKYVHRAPEVRRQQLAERGGSLETERAVSLSLRWLARHQGRDGRWDGKDYDDHCGKCEGQSKVESDVALTGLSLLCFLAADHSHGKPGPYQQVVKAGLDWLVDQQEDSGSLIGGESMYSHGIATIALAEAYGMTGDSNLEEAVQKAIDFIFDARNRSFGGWRYEPGQVGDTSVLGWQVMAMVSARKAGIDVPDEAFEVARKWLTKVRDPWKPGLYSYQPKRRVTPSMTAEAMFVNLMLGKDDPEEYKASAEYIVGFLPDWKRNTNTYFWYYATLALFQNGGDEWSRWNEVIKNELLAHQSTRGPTAGSWYPSGKWANVGGRVYQTALCCLTLEVYYRYLPAYVDEDRAVTRAKP